MDQLSQYASLAGQVKSPTRPGILAGMPVANGSDRVLGVPAAVDRLNRAVVELEGMVEELLKRLAPVIVPEPATEKDPGCSAMGGCGLVMAIDGSVESLNRVRHQIGSALRTLEL